MRVVLRRIGAKCWCSNRNAKRKPGAVSLQLAYRREDLLLRRFSGNLPVKACDCKFREATELRTTRACNRHGGENCGHVLRSRPKHVDLRDGNAVIHIAGCTCDV